MDKAKYTKYERKLGMENDFWQEGIYVPHNLQIEKLVLGSLLNNNLFIVEVRNLQNSDFFEPFSSKTL